MTIVTILIYPKLSIYPNLSLIIKCADTFLQTKLGTEGWVVGFTGFGWGRINFLSRICYGAMIWICNVTGIF